MSADSYTTPSGITVFHPGNAMILHPIICTRVLLAVAPLLALSCASPDPLAAWRDRVTTYIGEQGRGDPSILRELVDWNARSSHRPARPCIGVLGGTDARLPRAKDILGVLVGQHETEDRKWYVFLVGTLVHRGEERVTIRDIRAAAFAWENGKLVWRVGPPEVHSLERYIRARIAHSGMSRRRARAALSFPGLFDVFRLEGEGREIAVRETASGASWKLTLPPDSAVASIAGEP